MRPQRSARIRTSVKQVYDESHGIYGSYKIADRLKNDASLEAACRNTVATAMREMGLKSKVSKKFPPTTTASDPAKAAAPNVLNQSFRADAPDSKWVTNITSLPTNVGWVYLAVVLDLFSRKVVGWAVSESLATPLVSSALRNAVELRKPDTNGLLHYSDRGSQYTSDDYQQTLNMTCSLSRPRRALSGLLLRQCRHGTFLLVAQARRCVFQYIDTFYNSKRIHQTLEYRTPDEFEEQHRVKLAG